MIVVADTSPLNYLILLGETEILARFYGRAAAVSETVLPCFHPTVRFRQVCAATASVIAPYSITTPSLESAVFRSRVARIRAFQGPFAWRDWLWRWSAPESP